MLRYEGEWCFGTLVRTQETGFVPVSYGHVQKEAKTSPYTSLTDSEKDVTRRQFLASVIEKEASFTSCLKVYIDAVVAPLSLRDTAFNRSFMNEPAVAVSFELLRDMHGACCKFETQLRGCGGSNAGLDAARAYSEFASSLSLFGKYALQNSSFVYAGG